MLWITYLKLCGMQMIVRSMAPQIIVADEIGSMEEIDIIKYALCSGVKGIFTAHGSNMLDLKGNPALNKLMASNVFEKVIFLKGTGERGKIEKIYERNDDNKYLEVILNII